MLLKGQEEVKVRNEQGRLVQKGKINCVEMNWGLITKGSAKATIQAKRWG